MCIDCGLFPEHKEQAGLTIIVVDLKKKWAHVLVQFFLNPCLILVQIKMTQKGLNFWSSKVPFRACSRSADSCEYARKF